MVKCYLISQGEMLSPETWPVYLRKWQRKQLFQNTFGEFSMWIWFLSNLILYMKKTTEKNHPSFLFRQGCGHFRGNRRSAVSWHSPLGPQLFLLTAHWAPTPPPVPGSLHLCSGVTELFCFKCPKGTNEIEKVNWEWNFERYPLNCLVIFFLIVRDTKEFIHFPVAFQISPWKIIPIRLFGASVHGHFLRETKRAQPEETGQELGPQETSLPFT